MSELLSVWFVSSFFTGFFIFPFLGLFVPDEIKDMTRLQFSIFSLCCIMFPFWPLIFGCMFLLRKVNQVFLIPVSKKINSTDFAKGLSEWLDEKPFKKPTLAERTTERDQLNEHIKELETLGKGDQD